MEKFYCYLLFHRISYACSDKCEGGKQQQALEYLKYNIISAPVLALPNLRQPFKIQTDASDYAMGTILLQHGKPITFHSETFNGVVNNYHTYDK